MQAIRRVRFLRAAGISGTAITAAAALSLASATGAGASAGVPGYSVTTLQIPGGAGGVAVDPTTATAYVGTLGDVDVISEATGKITDQVGIGSGPGYDVAIDAATDTVYVATYGAVDVIDGATDSVTATISLPSDVVAVTLDPTTGVVYAADDEGADIAAISATSDTVLSTTSLGTGFGAFHLAMNPGTNVLYAGVTTSSGTGALWAMDGSTLAVDHKVAFSGSFPGVDLNQTSGTLYVTDSFGVYTVNPATYAVAQISKTAAAGVAVDSAAGTVIVGENSSVDVLNATTGKVITSVPVAAYNLNGHGVALDPASGVIYAANRGATTDTVSQLTPGIAPVITSAAAATFTAGHAGTFKVTTAGGGTATVSLKGKLPAGVKFRPGPSGTALITGIPAAHSGGRYRLTLAATNGVFPAASQAFTLTVDQAAAIVSSGRAVFRAGRRGRFLVVSQGFPAPRLRETGRLPHGFKFQVRSNGTAELTGDPVASQVGKRYTLKITATNGVGRPVTRSLTIVIS
jgi:large repetitive protein